jgi:hypothetical protein
MNRENLLSPDPEEVTFLRYFMAENGQNLLNESVPPNTVRVIRRDGVWKAVLTFGERERYLVVKDVSGNTSIKSPDHLWQVQCYMGSKAPCLKGSFPGILAVVPDRKWIVMEYISGSILEDILCGVLRGEGKSQETVNVFLSRVMDVFLAMKTLSFLSSEMAFLSETKSKFLTYYETLFQIRWVRRCLPSTFSTYEKFTAGFDRQLVMLPFHHLVPGDCQPKNVIITEMGMPCLIDPDYARGNIFLGMAFFLASLDRIGSRYPLPKTQSILSHWKRLWMAGLWEIMGPAFVEEITFYYPFALAQTAQFHLSNQRWFTPYLCWYYGKHLRSFFKVLEAIIVRDRREAVLELFGHT